jgi:hypothetical protein
MPTAVTRDGRSVAYLEAVIGEGGEKHVYFTNDKSEVVCLYKEPDKRSSDNEQKRLNNLLTKFNPTIGDNPKACAHFKKLFCWPTAIIDQPKLGIITPTYPSNFFFEDGKKPFIKGKEKNVLYHTSPKLRKHLLDKDLGNFYTKVRACLHISRAIRKLHMIGVAHSDISNNNVLIDLQKGTAVVIDLDSCVVPDYFPAKVLGTKGYIAPEVVQTQHLEEGDPHAVLPSIYTDRHALAVLFYEILFLRHPLQGKIIHDPSDVQKDDTLRNGKNALFIEDPKDKRNRPDQFSGSKLQIENLHTLKHNFTTTFSNGLHSPHKRASAPRWEKAFLQTIDLTIPCENKSCEEKFFLYSLDGQRPICPICNTRYSRPIPIITLLSSNNGSRYHARSKIAGYDKRWLFEYHVYNDKPVDESAANHALAQVRFYKGAWYVQNRNIKEGMRTSDENIVPINGLKALTSGDRFKLSNSHKSFVAEVQITK